MSRLPHLLAFVAAFVLAFMIPYKLGVEGNRLLISGFLLLFPCGIILGVLFGAIRLLFPIKLLRDETWESGGILHLSDSQDSSEDPNE